MKKTFILFLSLSYSFLFSQTIEQRLEISKHSNQVENAKLLEELTTQQNERNKRLTEYFTNNPKVERKTNFNGVLKEIVDVLPNGKIIYAQTLNAGVSQTSGANRLYNGATLGLNIQGQNMTAAVWDGGISRTTHQEFMVNGVSKVNNSGGGTFEDHPTHVVGTIAAQGIDNSVRGIAFNSSIKSFDWNSDLVEMTTEVSNGLLVSNHSYIQGEWGQLWFYGAYDTRALQIDALCYNNPFYLPVFAAANSRDILDDEPEATQIANKGGYDLIPGHANTKNSVTVGAVLNVDTYTSPSSVIMSEFSSWGPSDDGRIKPDIVTKGVDVNSTMATSDTDTSVASGTSQAAPGVTGVVVLLQQYFNQLNSSFMRSATAKGLLLHTALEAGANPGPDYSYGWGLVNAESAAIAIRDRNLTTNGSVIDQLNLTQGQTYTKTVSANGSTPLQVSISWTDPAFNSPNTGDVDPTTTYLINDLDVKVTKDGVNYYPWKLQGMTNPAAPATNTSTNNVDNFERIDIPNPNGTYTISVTHKGILTGASQNYSLIVTGPSMTLGTKDLEINENNLVLYPNPTSDYLNIVSTLDIKEITLFDINGKLIEKSIKYKNNSIDVSSLEMGNYIILFETSNGSISKFFTKK
jgi:subtilisin family serine protease